MDDLQKLISDQIRDYCEGHSHLEFDTDDLPEMTRKIIDIVNDHKASEATGKGKRYNLMHNVGTIKYLVSFHNGESLHQDGSDFFNVATFSNKLKLAKFEKELVEKGYVYD